MDPDKRFAVNQFTTKPLSFQQDLDLCQLLKIQAIELCENKLGDNATQQRDNLARLKDSGISLRSVQSRVHSVFPDRLAPHPFEPGDRIRVFEQCMETISANHVGENLAFVVISGCAPQDNFRRARFEVVAQIRHLADAAAEYGQRIAFEPLHPYFMQHDSFVCTLADAREIIEEVQRPNVGLVFDVWHLWQEVDIVQRIAQIIDAIHVVHVSDYPAEGPRCLDDRLIPGMGIINLPDLLGALQNAGYQGDYCLEILSSEDLPDSLWQQNMQKVLEQSRDSFRHILSACTAGRKCSTKSVSN